MSNPPGPPGNGPADNGDQTPQSPLPGSYPPPYGSPYGGGVPGPFPLTNGKATAALVIGISSLVLSWCCGLGLVGIVAVVLGVKARGEIRASNGMQTGDGVALAGIITGAIAIVLAVLAVVILAIAIATGNAQFNTDVQTGSI